MGGTGGTMGDPPVLIQGAGLADLLDEARELAALRLALRPSDPPPAGLGWLSTSHVRGIGLVREADGWHCDVELDGVGPGRPDCIGPRGAAPSRDGAVSAGRSLLCDVVLSGAATRYAGGRLPVRFPFHDAEVSVPGDALAILDRCETARMGTGYVRRRLATLGETLRPPPAAGPSWVGSLAPAARAGLVNVCGMAVLKAIARWPERGGG